jgi:hypothetical protein
MLQLVPISQKTAKDAVRRWHRHNSAPVAMVFCVGVATDAGTLVAVGVGSIPSARLFNDGRTIEITRVASDGTRNASSMLYGALTRAAFALGYRRVITYTRADEPGSSLRAAGWHVVAERPATPGWDRVSRPRDDRLYDSVPRTLWEA